MKAIYLLLGGIFLVIGVIGTVMPGIPGVPFLLLTLVCFSKGSERLHQWFIQTTLYHKHLKSFHQQRALSKKAKIRILTFSTLMLAISFYFAPNAIVRGIILVALLLQYFAFFFWIKTIRD
ncbi:MAG: YbaN family protein [[Pasteurella] aerogenes]|nr:YbaN family protein [[Pasteurella] aerogenes]